MSEKIIELASGRQIRADAPERVHLLAPDGTVELIIDLSSGSPRVRLNASQLDLAVEGKLRLSAEEIELESRRGTTLKAGGELGLHADEDVVVTGTIIHLN